MFWWILGGAVWIFYGVQAYGAHKGDKWFLYDTNKYQIGITAGFDGYNWKDELECIAVSLLGPLYWYIFFYRSDEIVHYQFKMPRELCRCELQRRSK